MRKGGRWSLVLTPTARLALTEPPPVGLPLSAALAVREFINGALVENPHRVGKRLMPPLDDRFSARRGSYCVIYRIDEARSTVTVIDVAHRAHAYRRR